MSRKSVKVATALLAAVLAAAGPASAQIPCGLRAAIAAQLKQVYAEEVVGMGLSDAGSLVELFVSPAGTWTVLLTSPQGISCMIGTGTDWNPRVAANGVAASGP